MTAFWAEVWHEHRKRIMKRHGWEATKGGPSHTDRLSPRFHLEVKKLSTSAKGRLIVEFCLLPEVVVSPHGADTFKGERLDETARHYGVDPNAIRKRLQTAPRAAARKKAAKAKKGKKGATKAPKTRAAGAGA